MGAFTFNFVQWNCCLAFLFCPRLYVCQELFNYDSKTISIAAEYWYTKHCWKTHLLNTDQQTETASSRKPFSWILPSSPTVAALCLWKMRRTRDHRILCLHWRPHCSKTPATAKRSELPGYWISKLSDKIGRSSTVESQPATNCSLKEWKIWKLLIMIHVLYFYKPEIVYGHSSFVFKNLQPILFVQVREWVSYQRLLKSFFELFLGSWYFFSVD